MSGIRGDASKRSYWKRKGIARKPKKLDPKKLPPHVPPVAPGMKNTKVAVLPSKKVRRKPGEKRVKAAGKKPAKRSYPEFTIQVTLASLLRTHYKNVLWFAIPNGGKRKPADAKRFKDMGVRSGVYDIFVSEPTPIYPGLYVEMKAPKGSLSDTQKEFRDMAEERGYKCVEATSAVDGLREIEEYLGVSKKSRVSSLAKT